jgi:predicted nucleic acid-binding protein
LTLYDCLYLALAIERGCSLFTADERFFMATSVAYPFVRRIGEG